MDRLPGLVVLRDIGALHERSSRFGVKRRQAMRVLVSLGELPRERAGDRDIEGSGGGL